MAPRPRQIGVPAQPAAQPAPPPLAQPPVGYAPPASTPAYQPPAPQPAFSAPVPAQSYAPPAVAAIQVPTTPITTDEFLQLGVGAKQKGAAIAQKITASVGMKDLEDLGKGMSSLTAAAREYDPSKWNKGLFGKLFRKGAAQLDNHFRSVNDNVNTLLGVCKKQIDHFVQMKADLTIMIEENAQAYIDFGKAIEMGTARIAWAEANPPAVDPADPMTGTYRQNWDTALVFAKRALDDLHRDQADCLTTTGVLNGMKQNCDLLVMGFDRGIYSVVPALQRVYAQYTMSIGQKKGVALLDAMQQTYEDTKRKGADLAYQNAIGVNTALSRSSISIETLTYESDKLFQGTAEVEKIRTDMLARLKTEAPQVAAIAQRYTKAVTA